MRPTVLTFIAVACGAAAQGFSHSVDTLMHKPFGLPKTATASPSVVATSTNKYATTPPAEVTKKLVPPTDHFKHFDCGTHAGTASDHFLNTAHELHQNTLDSQLAKLPGSQARRDVKRATANFNVPLYIHVVTTKANANTVSKQMVAAQVAAMNAAYKPHGITFILQGTDWSVNDAWAVGATSDDDAAMKRALRRGTYSSLNLYMQSDLYGGVLGLCTLPTDIGSNATQSSYSNDGCNIAAGTMPGGPLTAYNLGFTAVHETGHWLGLLHTFEGNSCSGNGDFIADTPAEAVSTDGCPTSPWKNSCPSRYGVDPIHNYMDYSFDTCYTRFTPGQEARMKTLWPTYRQGR